MEERYLEISRNVNKVQNVSDHVPFPCNVTGRIFKIYYHFLNYLLFIFLLFIIYYHFLFPNNYLFIINNSSHNYFISYN